MPENKNQEHADGEMTNAYGSIKISEEAVAGIVGMVLAQIKGIAAGPTGLTEKLGKKNSNKGVRVEVDGQEIVVSLQLYVEYGVRIPTLALEIQNTVRDAVQRMTGLKVREVNIYVQGISFERVEPAEGNGEKTETEV